MPHIKRIIKNNEQWSVEDELADSINTDASKRPAHFMGLCNLH